MRFPAAESGVASVLHGMVKCMLVGMVSGNEVCQVMMIDRHFK